MNLNPTNNQDDERLRSLLREHAAPIREAEILASPDFRATVWGRIDARRDGASWAAWLRAHVLGVAASTVACITVAVVSAGFLAGNESRREREVLIQRYITSIDPVLKTTSVARHSHDHR